MGGGGANGGPHPLLKDREIGIRLRKARADSVVVSFWGSMANTATVAHGGPGGGGGCTGSILPGKVSGEGGRILPPLSPSSNTCTTLPTPLNFAEGNLATLLEDENFPIKLSMHEAPPPPPLLCWFPKTGLLLLQAPNSPFSLIIKATHIEVKCEIKATHTQITFDRRTEQ